MAKGEICFVRRDLNFTAPFLGASLLRHERPAQGFNSSQYIAKLKEPRKSDVAALDKLIRKATKFEPFIQSGMLAYGHCRLKYAGGREADWFRIGLASNASYVSLYISAPDGTADVVKHYKKALPKANIGKCCVRFKRLDDLDPSALAKLLKEGAKDSATK